MYPKVRGLMAERNITLKMIGSDPRIDCTTSTICKKLNGSAPLTFGEAVAIKDILKTDLTLEELFTKEVD